MTTLYEPFTFFISLLVILLLSKINRIGDTNYNVLCGIVDYGYNDLFVDRKVQESR